MAGGQGQWEAKLVWLNFSNTFQLISVTFDVEMISLKFDVEWKQANLNILMLLFSEIYESKNICYFTECDKEL